ncbi:flagellar attachment zone protein 1-like protein [Lasius niger]|uniref:Flagellar attachment zone protein 1-like protein n=1 Tax=Lasius niger TaxID=67767 RepID=A0A0J7KQL2_LASNI|nr:flagellar attachment zone protein 1-like protein [Lasius niger]
MILNGNGKREGGWTYIGEVRASVIDYVSNGKAIEEVKKIEEGNRTESDHVPLEMELEGTERKEKRKKEILEVERSIWTEEKIEQYNGRCEGWTSTQTENGKIWRELEKKVKNSITKVKKKIIPWKLGRREWHSKE